jgi:hypothetical protein
MLVGSGLGPASAQKCSGEPFEVAVNTPPEAIAKIVVRSDVQRHRTDRGSQAKAVAIVKKTIVDKSKLDSKAADFRQKLGAVDAQRNADLMALVSKESDKAKLTACFKKMEAPPRGGGPGE